MDDTVIVSFCAVPQRIFLDIEVPTDLTVIELLKALNQAFGLGVDITDVKQCYLKMENPIALMRGNKLVSDYGIRNGSIIYFG